MTHLTTKRIRAVPVFPYLSPFCLLRNYSRFISVQAFMTALHHKLEELVPGFNHSEITGTLLPVETTAIHEITRKYNPWHNLQLKSYDPKSTPIHSVRRRVTMYSFETTVGSLNDPRRALSMKSKSASPAPGPFKKINLFVPVGLAYTPLFKTKTKSKWE